MKLHNESDSELSCAELFVWAVILFVLAGAVLMWIFRQGW